MSGGGKNLAAANAFLTALASAENRARLSADALLVALVGELVARQSRYRRLHEDYGSAVCRHCPHGGCCRREFVRVLDLLPRLAVDLPLPRAVNDDPHACAFLDAGCTLVPAPLPNICTAFHCGSLLAADPPGFGAESVVLADEGEKISRLITSHLLSHYFLYDVEGEIDIRSPAVLIASQTKAPLMIERERRPDSPLKSVPYPTDLGLVHVEPRRVLPVVD